MAYSWGSTVLCVLKGTYRLPKANNSIKEISILPAIGDTSPASILQQGGRDRYRVKFSCFVRAKSEYDAFLSDHLNAIERVFKGNDGESMPMLIEELGEAEHPVSGLYTFNITLIEV